MKHLGDITQIRGSGIEPVDCIAGGSPCQDLSLAGKRAGLAGERSGLFMEQIRIIKEMREHERSAGRTGIMVRPRYMVWENVPGAFSSRKGKDFAAVLEETLRIAEPKAPSVPVPENGWPTSGILHDEMGAWSVAWRVHDAQFWGVPQRRRRIALVADFGGMSAPEILFERKGLPGYLTQGRWTWEASSGCFATCIVVPNQEEPCRDGIRYGKVGEGRVRVYENHQQDNRTKELGETCCTLVNRFGTGGNNLPIIGPESNLTPGESQARRIYSASGIYPSLPSREKAGGDQTAVLNEAVRRLTPLECERLQGYPDGWTDIPDTEVNGKKVRASDSARYKALGNSIALPFWTWMFERMSGYLPHNATLGSLFDGIGGFPLCWERIHGKGTARWASEVEPFCIAVSKRRLGE